ncbi:MAG: hypothetical protein FK734_16020 [Asgard group archaeon]|nr:hypothetical protein [Asgard group archaeon]
MFFRKLKEAAKELADGLSEAVDSVSKEVSGEKSAPDETDTLPVKCTIRVHSKRYNRLSMKTRVEVSNRKEYEDMKKNNILPTFRQKYGSFSTMSGKSINVWSDKIFNEIIKTIAFEDQNLVDALKKHGKW